MFKQISLSTIAGISIIALGSLANPETALALSATSTFLDLDGLPDGIDEVVMNWSTNVNHLITPTIEQDDLNNWTILLKSNGGTIYTDNVIIDGSIQPIGGVPRSLLDIDFQYVSSINSLSTTNNDAGEIQRDNATGATYQIMGGLFSFGLNEYDNGGLTGVFYDPNIAQNTIINSTAVPFEMSPTLGLLIVGGIWGYHHVKYLRQR